MHNLQDKIETGLRYQQEGNLQAAEALYRDVLNEEPGNPDALHLMGLLASQLGSTSIALELVLASVQAQPQNALFRHNLGNLYKTGGRLDDAETQFQEALRLSPRMIETYLDLGETYREQKHFDQAVESYQAALKLDSQCVLAHTALGEVLRLAGKFDASVSQYYEALNLSGHASKTENARAHAGLGDVLFTLGKFTEGLKSYTSAIQQDPYNPEYHCRLGEVFFAKQQLALSEKSYKLAVQLDEKSVQAWLGLGQVYELQGQVDEARLAYQTVNFLKPSAGIQVKLANLLPPVYESEAHLEATRLEFIQNIDTLLANHVHIANPVAEVGSCPFYLAYQGKNDKVLLSKISQLYSASVKTYPVVTSRQASSKHLFLQNPPAHHSVNHDHVKACKKPKIGFVSRYFFSAHTISKLNKGLIDNLDREQFDVVVFSIGGDYPKPSGSHYQDDRYLRLPVKDLELARQMIVDEQPDLLFYTDIGMEAVSFALAQSRLAPVQCVTWGHPVTTGIPNVDYFISSDLIEPEAGASHYTETLIRLKHLPAFYQRPGLAGPEKKRSDFGLDENDHLYLCPQSLFKLHPGFDATLRSILEKDPDGKLVLIHYTYPHHNELVKARLKNTLGDAYDRVVFIDRLDSDDFRHLLNVADVILDPFYFGSGSTALEALSFGTPIVTLPGELMRGRAVLGCYRAMGFNVSTDRSASMSDLNSPVKDLSIENSSVENFSVCIAETPTDYAQKAVQLGTGPRCRSLVKQEILSRCEVLYENPAVVRELETFFRTAIAQSADSTELFDSDFSCPPQQ